MQVMAACRPYPGRLMLPELMAECKDRQSSVSDLNHLWRCKEGAWMMDAPGGIL